MRNPSLVRWLGALALFFALLLSFGNLVRWYMPPEEAAAEARAIDLSSLEGNRLALDAGPDFAFYQPVLARPLFSETRSQTQRRVVAEVEPEPTQVNEWFLSGVVNFDQSGYAIFAAADGSERVRLEPGMVLDEWVVRSVQTGRVTFEKDGEQVVLTPGQTASF